jgi:hypothetical protein
LRWSTATKPSRLPSGHRNAIAGRPEERSSSHVVSAGEHARERPYAERSRRRKFDDQLEAPGRCAETAAGLESDAAASRDGSPSSRMMNHDAKNINLEATLEID